MFAEAPLDLTMMAFSKESEDDKKLHVMFHMHPWLNKEKSAAEGRPIYDDREYISIMVPGDATSIVDRPIMDSDKERFPQKYSAFKNRQSQEAAGGTPLSAVSFLQPAQIRELQHFNCYTVEQLATIPDGNVSKFQGIQGLKRLAIAFLEQAKGNAPITKMQKELESRDSEIAALKEAMAQLQASIANLSNKAA